jgi:hypothetical protein
MCEELGALLLPARCELSSLTRGRSELVCSVWPGVV